MTGPPPAIAAVRVAVRTALAEHQLSGDTVVVACSGGVDSLALALAAGFEVPRAGGQVGAVIVDHQLQPNSALVASEAATACRGLGLDPVHVATVDVVAGSGGLEDAARQARMAALQTAAREQGARAVLVGHTRDDQAEQVLLGLIRGSGTRSLSGMPGARPLRQEDGSGALTVLRPFLNVPRQVTWDACASADLKPWQDPHNSEERFTRVRARAALADLHDRLDPGIGAALARSADVLRADADALDDFSDTAYAELGAPPWPVEQLAAHPRAIRSRLWQRMVTQAGSPPGGVSRIHLDAIDDLIRGWHGQGPITVPGGVEVHRGRGLIWAQGPQPG
ncbi:MAG: tRNA lysidine(34) synthetase TilS [Ornithinimicrobium sp.]